MLTIRSFFLDAVALIGVGAGVAAGLGGYLAHMPDRPEHVAVAAARAEPETTGAIPRAGAWRAEADRSGGAVADGALEADEAGPRGAWTDPPRRRRPR